jgi:hypothetical protein
MESKITWKTMTTSQRISVVLRAIFAFVGIGMGIAHLADEKLWGQSFYPIMLFVTFLSVFVAEKEVIEVVLVASSNVVGWFSETEDKHEERSQSVAHKKAD